MLPRRPGPAIVAVVALALGLAACTMGGPLGGGGRTAALATTVRPFVVHSAELGIDMPSLIFLPRGYDEARTYPVLYLFHGYGGNAASWMSGNGGDGVGVDRIAQGLIDSGSICPVVIVSASIGNSYGVDSAGPTDAFDHGPYEKYITDDLIPSVEAAYPNLAGKAGRFVGGLSMGGFAALHLAFRHPDLVAGVGGLSPAIFIDTPPDRQWLFAGSPATQDPIALAKTADLAGLDVFLGYGDADYGWIRDGVRELTARLAVRGVQAAPVVVPGSHEVATWRQLAPALLRALFSPPCTAATS